MPGLVWDDATKLRLLLAVIEYGDTKLSMENWKSVATVMGSEVTASAVSQKFYKLKKESERLSAETSTSYKASAKPRTPRKRKANDDETEADTPKSNQKRGVKENGTSITIKSEPDTNGHLGEDVVDGSAKE